ncbi:ABC transporter ATP-binding protein [Rhizobium halophytocola]|uniref:ABC-type sugar transport system ATPase subunit n=1 Tax=Rhizobium halophytocola TaxID=735519 RepID=A0ABS4E0Z2_9HYPH|nr:sn-glycerol-3-phosphate ABC transporter ATP-binding protein UgpC [Rhizobium halophytocola]MBP1851612.1 ABC-type sugar transport system ATPase subunit [Rhizobium halophytocola]
MADVRLSSIAKSFGALTVVRNVDLEIASGELVVFVGPSGCGKSTLLRMIAGLEPISQGKLMIGGADMTDVDPAKRGIAMVFQSYALYPHMTVRENMGFALRFAGMPKAEIAERVASAAKILELDALMERKPGALSGGQRQRVAIGRAIVRHPDVFLFDEPLSNLDAELRVHMRAEIADLHNRLKSTMIYVTHDQVEAMTLADRIVVLKKGEVEQVGSPLDVYNRPANLFVAGFIGSPRMNFLPAMLGAAGDGKVEIAIAGGDAVVIDWAGELPVENVRVTTGVRPQNVRLAADGEPGVRATVELVESLGAETVLHLRLSGGDAVLAVLPGQQALRVGAAVRLTFDSAALHVFGKDERRIGP